MAASRRPGHLLQWAKVSDRLLLRNRRSRGRPLPDDILPRLMENVCPNSRYGQEPSASRPFSILVEGNIGSGKTTFLKQFAHLSNTTILPEPVQRWSAIGGGRHNLLQLMYEQPKKYALALQTYVQLTMLQNHRQQVTTPYKMMERSLYSARYCFVENLFCKGVLSEVETLVLDEWFQHLITTEEVACKADLVVYLQTDPEVARRRVQLRDREGERAISLDYVRSIHDVHEQWFGGRSKFPLPAKHVLILDGNKSPEAVRDEFNRCVMESQLIDDRNFIEG